MEVREIAVSTVDRVLGPISQIIGGDTVSNTPYPSIIDRVEELGLNRVAYSDFFEAAALIRALDFAAMIRLPLPSSTSKPKVGRTDGEGLANLAVAVFDKLLAVGLVGH